MQNGLTEQGKTVKGFKATDQNMECKGFKFKLNEWYEHKGDISLCEQGFHFCPHMSGVWAYYPENSRVFEIEAEYVWIDYQPGADLKYVAKKIRLVKEVKIGGNCNTGYSNTGNWNTGNRNTGNWNTGDRNTGNWNTGNCNTGYSNTGNWNTGDSNTGDSNTGNWNTGNWNTGDSNTGNRNTGDSNTGNWNTGNCNTGYSNTGNRNTGDWNATDRCAGFFCQNKQKMRCFDVETSLTYDQFMDKYEGLHYALSRDLMQDESFDYHYYKALPGWTLRRIKSLHKKHVKARNVPQS